MVKYSQSKQTLAKKTQSSGNRRRHYRSQQEHELEAGLKGKITFVLMVLPHAARHLQSEKSKQSIRCFLLSTVHVSCLGTALG